MAKEHYPSGICPHDRKLLELIEKGIKEPEALPAPYDFSGIRISIITRSQPKCECAVCVVASKTLRDQEKIERKGDEYPLNQFCHLPYPYLYAKDVYIQLDAVYLTPAIFQFVGIILRQNCPEVSLYVYI